MAGRRRTRRNLGWLVVLACRRHGYATDDGVGLVFAGTTLVEAVADRPDRFAHSVRRAADGTVQETVIEPRRLR